MDENTTHHRLDRSTSFMNVSFQIIISHLVELDESNVEHELDELHRGR
jgi:hypothetical protein